MQELQNIGKLSKGKVVKKQELWGAGFDGKLQKMETLLSSAIRRGERKEHARTFGNTN
jgi:hypothetical protein